MAVHYEWIIEESDEHGDIFDVRHYDAVPVALMQPNEELGLLRKEGNEDEGITDRLVAYVKDGRLPEFFENAWQTETDVQVPKRFHAELAHRA